MWAIGLMIVCIHAFLYTEQLTHLGNNLEYIFITTHKCSCKSVYNSSLRIPVLDMCQFSALSALDKRSFSSDYKTTMNFKKLANLVSTFHNPRIYKPNLCE